MQPISYARHQFPAEIIRHAVWLYLRFTLSYRDVEELLAGRCHTNPRADRSRPEGLRAQAAAVALTHCSAASALKRRSVRREIR